MCRGCAREVHLLCPLCYVFASCCFVIYSILMSHLQHRPVRRGAHLSREQLHPEQRRHPQRQRARRLGYRQGGPMLARLQQRQRRRGEQCVHLDPARLGEQSGEGKGRWSQSRILNSWIGGRGWGGVGGWSTSVSRAKRAGGYARSVGDGAGWKIRQACASRAPRSLPPPPSMNRARDGLGEGGEGRGGCAARSWLLPLSMNSAGVGASHNSVVHGAPRS
jgi:hypothetical protein